jgi:hypothetical protein
MGNSTSGLSSSANQLSSEQASVFNSLLSQLGGMQGEAGQDTMLNGPLASLWQSILGPGGAGGQAPADMSQFMNLAMNPQALAQLTGINAGQLTGQATSYLSNPNATNLAQTTPGVMSSLQGPQQLGTAGPQAESFYRNEMQNGINPQYAQNAQNQLQQQYSTGLNTALAQAAPGQNTNALMQGLNNQLLSSSSNLGGQLAGMGQQYSNQGAQGLVGTAETMQQNTLQNLMAQLQTAGGLDAQKMAMLTGGAQLGNQYNQTVLGDAQQGANMGAGALSGAQSMVNMGNQLGEFGASSLQGLGTTLGNESFDYTQLASQIAAQNNPWSEGLGALGALGGLGSDLGTMGGSGGIGALFKNKSANPNNPGTGGTGMTWGT